MEEFANLFERIAARQHRRILRLSFPHDDGPAALLVIESLAAIESLSRDFAFTLELLSDDATIPLKALQGKLVSVELVRGDGTLRYFSGHIFGFSLLRHDGVVAWYEARVGPWLQYLQLRRNSRLFHNNTLHEQADAIFGAYGASVCWEDRAPAGTAMAVACQFGESDHNYLSRRWEAAGLFYWYEHDAAGHRLVLADDSTANPAIDGDETVIFQQRGGARHEDSLSDWSPARRITPTGVVLSSFDFKFAARQGGGRACNGTSLNSQGEVPDLSTYEYTGARGFRNSDDGERLAALRMQELDAGGKYYEGAGNNRHMMPGRWFRLTVHATHATAQGDDAERDVFLVIEARHTATNNYLQMELEPAYDNHIVCIRRQVPWRPGRGHDSLDTRILAPQTATVVNFQGQDAQGQDNICTDEYGRVRLRFHWDRDDGGDGAGTSAWVRVAGAWNGAELGAAAIPRIGSEVLVQWLDGNPDRPIVTGAVPNSGNMPPWELPGQRALTGLRSRELTPGGGNATGGRSNHLVLDDTAGAIQAQLKSDHEHSQLSLGHITRIDDWQGRKDARGEGWELRSDAWGVARAAKGMLITTETRPRAASHIKDLTETAAHLDNAHARQQALAELAQQHGAQEQQGQQADVADAVQNQNSDIAGKSGAAFPQLSAPELVLASAAGIALAAAGSTHIASEQHAALTAGKKLAIASGGFFASVRETLRLFVHKAGMRLVAAAGDIDLNALSDGINLLAKLQITQSAGRITINAKEEVVINGGGSYIRLQAGGIESGSKGDFVVHAATHQWNGAAGNPPKLPALPAFQEGKAPRNWIALHYLNPDTATGVDGAPYEIHFTDGSSVDGKLDSQGKAMHDNVNDLPVKEVLYQPRQPGDEPEAAPLEALNAAAQ